MPREHTVTTGYVLTIAALALAAVPAVAAARTVHPPSSPADMRAANPPPGMLKAIQRDLDLTQAEARVRLLNEARLIPVAERLSKALGPRFGGTWLRGDTAHTLVVATTSAADIPMILVAGAQAEVVPRPLTELIDIKNKLDAALPPKPLVSSVRYVDVKRNKVVVLTSTPQVAENFVQASDVDTRAVILLPSAEAPLPLYDLVGGNAYYIGTASRCSIGFSVTKGAQQGFATAGHCGNQGAATTGFNRLPQGVFQGSSFPGNDYAWVATNANWTATPTVDNGQGGVIPVAGARVAIEGASTCRSGSTTDWHCGLIQQRNASITYPQGTVQELTRTSVCAEPGDSGGSFISIDQAQGVTSGGSGDCASGGTTYFQPIGEILSVYGLTLKVTAGGTVPPTPTPPPTTPPTTPPTNPTGCTGYPNRATGTLAPRQFSYFPRTYHTSRVRGVHTGCLDGPTGADFDLYLQKWNGSAWQVVALSNGPGPDERIVYSGTPGFYRYRVVNAGGSGPYVVAFRAP